MRTRMIPKNRIQEGIELCRKNVLDFLDEAKILISEGRLSHAYVSLQLAVEEFGKAAILRENII